MNNFDYFVKNIVWKDMSFFGSFVFYVFLMALYFIFGEYRFFVELTIALVLSFIITFFFKYFFYKDRPKKENYANGLQKLFSGSFPSMHAIRSTILLILLNVNHASANILFLIMTFFIFLGVCSSRVFIGKHFKSDVFGGVVIGVIISVLILIF